MINLASNSFVLILGLSSKTRASETILKYGIPDRGPDIRVYDNHILSYDQAKKTPVWVAEYITKRNIDGNN